MQRLFFVGHYKIIESVVTLHFDRFLPGIDHTHVFYGGPAHHLSSLQNLYDRFGIDTTTMSFHHDSAVPGHGHAIMRFGPWIYQQLLKFLTLDMIDSEHMMIQDSDTLMLETYEAFCLGQCRPLVVRNCSFPHDDYYRYVKDFLGIERQSEHCFVTEFVPVMRSHWHSLKHQVERLHGKPWLSGLSDLLEQDQPNNKMYLAEPEILGNWSVYNGCATFAQRRYSITSDMARAMKKGDFSGLQLEGRNAVCFINADDNSKFTMLDIDALVSAIENQAAITKR